MKQFQLVSVNMLNEKICTHLSIIWCWGFALQIWVECLFVFFIKFSVCLASSHTQLRPKCSKRAGTVARWVCDAVGVKRSSALLHVMTTRLALWSEACRRRRVSAAAAAVLQWNFCAFIHVFKLEAVFIMTSETATNFINACELFEWRLSAASFQA